MKNLLYALLVTIFTIQAHEFDFSELVKDQSESVVNIQSIRVALSEFINLRTISSIYIFNTEVLYFNK